MLDEALDEDVDCRSPIDGVPESRPAARTGGSGQ